MTGKVPSDPNSNCPAQALLKSLSGKWKLEIFRLAADGPVRFSGLLRAIAGSNRQALSVALREMEDAEFLLRQVVSAKPLKVEYRLSEQGISLLPVLRQLEEILSLQSKPIYREPL